MSTGLLSWSLGWTPEEYKHFEQLLAVYDKDTPDRWMKVARAVGKPVDDVKRQYKLLEDDVRRIEASIPSYSARSRGKGSENSVDIVINNETG